jgi:drug/metabolite transporter (DMT)-like permease
LVKIESPTGRSPGRATLAVAIAVLVVVWAVNFIAAKIGLLYLRPLAMASFRVVLAGVVMIPVYFSCLKFSAFAEAADLRRRGLATRDLWTFFYLGFFGVTVNQMCFTIGLYFTHVNHAAVIVGLGPIYILVLAVLFRLERATGHKVVGMLLALAGVAVLASENGISMHSASITGDGITMAGSIGFAIYAVLGKRMAGKYDTLTMTAFNHFAGALIVLPVAIHEAWALSSSRHWQLPWRAWAAVLYMAVFSSALGYVFYFWLLRYLEASQLSAFTYLLPVLATILGILWLGEKGSWGQMLGGLMALAGVYWIESGRGAVLKANTVP